MTRTFQFIIVFLLSITLFSLLQTYSPVKAEESLQQISWSELIPQEKVDFDDPFANLSEKQLYELSLVARYRELRQRGKLQKNNLDNLEETKLIASLKAQGIDIDWLLSQRQRVARVRAQQAEQFSALSGNIVRIAGYALPLTLKNNTLTEFLLVPWVGACIHTPPPPPNQIIHVNFVKGTLPRNRFSPVWIEGKLEAKSDDYKLFLVDGSRNIRATYNLVADKVYDYQASKSDELSRVIIPEQFLQKQPRWHQLQIHLSVLLTKAIADIEERTFSPALFFLLFVAFLYGVFHTLGPGHGKVVIISYFVGKGGSLYRGIGMGIRIAVLHVFAAVILVVLTDVIVRQVGGNAAGNFRIIRLISYSSIALIGAFMLSQNWQNLKNFVISSQPILSSSQDSFKKNNMLYPQLKDRIFEQEKLNLSRNHELVFGCRCFNCFDTQKTDNLLSLAVGAIPCSGALVILLYGLANNLLGPSILMVIAISIGMAVTLSSIGMFAIFSRKTINKKLTGSFYQNKISFLLNFLGAVMVFLVGSGLFAFTIFS
ncbi:MAG: DUF3299 domain-containing protein [Prochloraceae cyanobacterium]